MMRFRIGNWDDKFDHILFWKFLVFGSHAFHLWFCFITVAMVVTKEGQKEQAKLNYQCQHWVCVVDGEFLLLVTSWLSRDTLNVGLMAWMWVRGEPCSKPSSAPRNLTWKCKGRNCHLWLHQRYTEVQRFGVDSFPLLVAASSNRKIVNTIFIFHNIWNLLCLY